MLKKEGINQKVKRWISQKLHLCFKSWGSQVNRIQCLIQFFNAFCDPGGSLQRLSKGSLKWKFLIVLLLCLMSIKLCGLCIYHTVTKRASTGLIWEDQCVWIIKPGMKQVHSSKFHWWLDAHVDFKTSLFELWVSLLCDWLTSLGTLYQRLTVIDTVPAMTQPEADWVTQISQWGRASDNNGRRRRKWLPLDCGLCSSVVEKVGHQINLRISYISQEQGLCVCFLCGL